jgi:23S rRNA pseudouridine2605 synthase
MPIKKLPDSKEKYKRARKPFKPKINPAITDDDKPGLIRLNKFIANAGISSRREADKLIQSGVIKVNGKVVTDLGVKISPDDKVQYENETIKTEKKYYVLLNKPKGYITTTDDPFDRKTVMFLVRNACKERIYPVGRLDRETTGLLLLTNDGDLAKKLTHPRHRIKKIYHVVLDKNFKTGDLNKIANGIELEDGFVKPDAVAYVQGAESKKEIGIEIHSGKNRIIRRIFESLDYKLMKLDRVSFAGLTKKDIPRGKWRYLNEKEISFLKMK